MTTRMSRLLAIATLLTVAIATPVFSHDAKQGPEAVASVEPGAISGARDTSTQGGSEFTVGQIKPTKAPEPDSPWVPGNETATQPWSAPVGHHQPRASDAPTAPASVQQMLDEEDARIDRIVRSICRGC